MNLIKLTDQNVNCILDKLIVCYEKSAAYLGELADRFPGVFAKVEFIIEANHRYQVPVTVHGREFEVRGLEVLRELVGNNHIDNNHTTNNYAILITSDYFEEAFLKISNELLLSGIETVAGDIYYFPNHETEIELSYREKYADEPLQDIIVFRSGPHASSYVKGLDFADNARALFEYMLAAGVNEKYELIWFVKNPKEFTEPEGRYYPFFVKNKNVSFISFDWSVSENSEERDEYYRALCLAKWIFMTDAYGFARNCRKDQVRVQLWHGCGFKTRTNFVPCEHRYEYNIVIGEAYRKIHANIYGLREDQVLITGYPKSDWLYHPVDRKKVETMGICSAEGTDSSVRTIFWLPTFRVAQNNLSELNEKALSTHTGMPLVDTVGDLVRLNGLLVKGNCKLIIKLHPFQNREALSDTLENAELSNIILLGNEQLVEQDVQIGQLLAYADALISDYSSVAVEYMLLDRPIAFTLDDASEYENSRGFVFDNLRDNLPGKELYTFEDYLEYVGEIIDNMDSTARKRHQLTDKFHLYKDDRSSERVVKALGIS